MKTCYLIRHAKSSWADPSLRDIDRPLNNRGLRDAPFMANLLKGKGIVADQLVSSPANRAFTTATYFAAAQGLSANDIEKKKEIYEAYPEELHNLILTFPDDWNAVFMFGHNPGFTSLANRYASEYIPNVPTCGIVCLESEAKSWLKFNPSNTRMTAFYYPKQYFS